MSTEISCVGNYQKRNILGVYDLSMPRGWGLLEDRLQRWVARHLTDVEHGMKKDVAKAIDKPRPWLSGYLKHKRHADLDTSLALLRVLGLTLDQLAKDQMPRLTPDDLEVRALWAGLDAEDRNLFRRQLRAHRDVRARLSGAQRPGEARQSELAGRAHKNPDAG